MCESQFRFRAGYITRKVFYVFNRLVQRRLNVNEDVKACFVDYNNAFDRDNEDQLIEILGAKLLENRDRVICNQYYSQKVYIKLITSI